MDKSKINLLNISCLFFVIFLLFAFMQPNTSNAQAQSIGKIIEVKGQVSVTRATGEKVSGSVGLDIYRDDALRTGRASLAKIEFNDKTVLTLFENSEIVLSEFVYSPSTKKRDAVVELVKGEIRSAVTQTLAEESTYKVKTRNAVMGIRGTIALSKFTKRLFTPITIHALVEGVAFVANAGQNPFTEGIPISAGMQAKFVGSKAPVIEMINPGEFIALQDQADKEKAGDKAEEKPKGEAAEKPEGEGEGEGEPEAMSKETKPGATAPDAVDKAAPGETGGEPGAEPEAESLETPGGFPKPEAAEGADKLDPDAPSGEPESMAKEVDSRPSVGDAVDAVAPEPGDPGDSSKPSAPDDLDAVDAGPGGPEPSAKKTDSSLTAPGEQEAIDPGTGDEPGGPLDKSGPGKVDTSTAPVFEDDPTDNVGGQSLIQPPADPGVMDQMDGPRGGPMDFEQPTTGPEEQPCPLY